MKVTELTDWERRIKIIALENGLCHNLICSFCWMHPIPAHIALRITTSFCCDIPTIHHLFPSTENFRVKVVGTTPMSTACFGAILETCPKSSQKKINNGKDPKTWQSNSFSCYMQYHEVWGVGRALAAHHECSHIWQRHLGEAFWFGSVPPSAYCYSPPLPCCKRLGTRIHRCLNCCVSAAPEVLDNNLPVQD